MFKLLKRLGLATVLVVIGGGLALRNAGCRAMVEPHAQVVSASVASWSLAEVELQLETDITNPSPLSASVSDIPCQLTIGGLEMGTAHIPAGTSLKPSAVTRVSIPLHTPLSALGALLAQGLERGFVRPYQVHCTLMLDLWGQSLSVPFEKTGWVDLTRHQLLKSDRTPE